MNAITKGCKHCTFGIISYADEDGVIETGPCWNCNREEFNRRHDQLMNGTRFRNDMQRSPYPENLGFKETREHRGAWFQYGAIYFGDCFAGRYIELCRRDGRRLFYLELRT